MRPSVLYYTLALLICLLLSPPQVAHASSAPPDSANFCAPIDYEQWRRDHPLPAAKRLAGLNVGEPLTVRMIYFLPSDRSPQQDIDAKMDEVMKNVQLSYAEVMEYHGFGRKTFRLETDGDGKAVVHHVRGKFNDEYYHTDTYSKVVWQETAEQFDLSANIYFIVLDVSTANIDGFACGQGAPHGPEGGATLIPAPNSARQRERGWSCFNVAVSAHELGHAFGLAHDLFINASRSPSSYHTDWMVTSFCAAEWLDAHRYFNIGQSYPKEDQQTTIQMLPPLAVPPYAIRLRFEVTDPDGLHQAQLHNSTGDAIDCQGFGLDGKSGSVEFTTSAVSEAPRNHVGLRVVDVYGNVTEKRFSIDITSLHPPKVVSIPDANLAAVVREALDLTPADAISQLDMLRLGELEASRRQITDLTGLEHAVNLKGLSLGENQIRDITPLAGSTILESLDLRSNNISDLSPLAKFTNLSDLWLNDNNISDLSPLAKLTNLIALWLNDNNISDLSPLAKLTNLTALGFENNSVSDLSPLAKLTKLKELWLNNISDLSPLAGLTNLTALGLNDNNISDLSPLAKFTNLVKLELAANQISDITPLVGLTILESLQLGGNNISDISSLAKMTNLSRLHIGGNSVRDLSPLAGLINISSLELAYNRIREITPLAKLIYLVRLELFGNRISDISPLAELNHLGFLNTLDNPLSYSSINEHIPALRSRGVTVEFDTRVPKGLEKSSGDGQKGQTDTQLKEPFVVTVSDQNKTPFEGVPVSFAVTAGGGKLSLESTMTDSTGLASSTLTLGGKPGANTVTVKVSGIDEYQTFVAEALGLADFDGDGTVGFGDFVLFAAHFGQNQADEGFEARYDLDGNGAIGFSDFLIFAGAFGKNISSS